MTEEETIRRRFVLPGWRALAAGGVAGGLGIVALVALHDPAPAPARFTVITGWIARWIADGFTALEALVEGYGEGYCFGAEPTLADCALVPQLYSAERFGVDLSSFPALIAAGTAARAHPAIMAAHPDRQPDADTQ
jgi:glutathione S-transferase